MACGDNVDLSDLAKDFKVHPRPQIVHWVQTAALGLAYLQGHSLPYFNRAAATERLPPSTAAPAAAPNVVALTSTRYVDPFVAVI